MRAVGCVYFSIVGGAAPLLTEGARAVIGTGWDDLLTRFRLTRLRIEGFSPLTAAIDAHGNSRYGRLDAAARARLPAIIATFAAERRR